MEVLADAQLHTLKLPSQKQLCTCTQTRRQVKISKRHAAASKQGRQRKGSASATHAKPARKKMMSTEQDHRPDPNLAAKTS